MYFYGVFDACKCVCMGILRGAGRPGITVWGNALSCVLVGAPVCYWLAFVRREGLLGLWAGMSCAWIAATATYCCVIFARTDWAAEVEAAARRNERALQSAMSAGVSPSSANSAAEDPASQDHASISLP
jgi:Na+-driven multidrug efflux pump